MEAKEELKQQTDSQSISLPDDQDSIFISHKGTGNLDIDDSSLVELDAIPAASDAEIEYFKEITIEDDKRKKIAFTERWPNSVHGLVLSQYKNDLKVWGTGTMIGANLVITAAHNLYCHDLEEEVESVKFIPALNGRRAPFKEIDVIKYYYPEEYGKNSRREDYALLVLDKNIGEKTGYFGLHILPYNEIMKKVVNITGYPADKCQQKPKNFEMWSMPGRVEKVDEQHIGYKIVTYQGQSGSGVYYKEENEETEDKYYVIGVHIKFNRIAGLNQGTLLNERRYKQIKEWCKQANVLPPPKGYIIFIFTYLNNNIDSYKKSS